MFRHTDLSPDAEVAKYIRDKRLPINPYKMRNGRGIDFCLRARDVLDASLDVGAPGGCLFIVLNERVSALDVQVVRDLRDEEYRDYETVLAAKIS